MLVVDSATLKGKLVDLIGKSKTDVRMGNPRPTETIEDATEQIERFVWLDRAHNEESREHFPIYYMVRFHRGTAFAVGIWSERYLFILDHAQDGTPFFVALPKGPEHNQAMVNWVARDPNGNHYDFGVSY